MSYREPYLILRVSYFRFNTMRALFSKYIDCSVRCLSFLPLTISLHPPSFTLRPFLLLSSSSSSPSSPSLNGISDFLTKECGFSTSQVTALMRRKPTLLRNTPDHITREIIHNLKARMEFLKQMGLAPQDITRIISRNPSVLTASLENSLAPRILHLRTLFGSNAHLCQALKRVPDLLMADFESRVKPKVEYVKNNIGILEGSTAFLRAFRAVFGFRVETLEKKTKHMASLGLAEDAIHLILKRSPAIFYSSTKRIKENVDFLIHTAGLELKSVVLNPVILNLSVEKRLKPRYEVFKYLRTNPQSKGLPCLVTFFMLSEKEFIKLFGQYSTKLSLPIIESPKESILEQ